MCGAVRGGGGPLDSFAAEKAGAFTFPRKECNNEDEQDDGQRRGGGIDVF